MSMAPPPPPMEASGSSSSSAPVLPMLRQPSPIIFNPSSRVDSSLVSPSGLNDMERSNGVKFPLSREAADLPVAVARTPSSPASQVDRPTLAARTSSSASARRAELLPIAPQPDSLLLRSTFAALDHSASVLKRLSKSAISATNAYFAVLDQLERTEDELFKALGELGRWLESGYGIDGHVWDADGGLGKVRAERRRKEREEVEVMIDGQVKAVRAELKRNGLAGGGAQARYEADAKHFYTQTGAYLAPQGTPTGSAHHQMSSQAMASLPNPSNSSAHSTSGLAQQGELAQSARLSQFDMSRYNHHTALLYAVPPTSVTCLDLLVSMYTWSTSLISDGSVVQAPVDRSATMRKSRIVSESSVSAAPQLNGTSRGADLVLTSDLKVSITEGLASLSARRGDLMKAWARRDEQGEAMEQATALASAQSTRLMRSPSASQHSDRAASPNSLPSSSVAIEYKKPKRHRIHRSVGGRLMGLLTSSSSTSHLSTERSVNERERSERSSFDQERASRIPIAGARQPTVQEESGDERVQSRSQTAPGPPPSGRPVILTRHSVHYPLPEGGAVVSQSPYVTMPSSVTLSSPDLRLKQASTTATSQVAGDVHVSNVPVLADPAGDEDERRGEIGRKREGVLWSTGVWEEISRGINTKGKWERVWVVLDHSSIFEYRNIELGKSDVAPMVVDLKFASVREAKGGDRRFVFEIVTPKSGRRLYQATSERETQDWIYALTNAIESCINGTSSVRTFDSIKLRSAPGALDDLGLPAKRTFPSFPSRPSGLSGLINATAGSRLSMPPPSMNTSQNDNGVRQRKTSMKKIFRQSADAMGGKWDKMRANRGSFDNTRAPLSPPTPPWVADMERDSKSSRSNNDGSATSKQVVAPSERQHSALTPSPSKGRTVAHSPIVDRMDGEAGDEIERRVLQMSGVGLGSPGEDGRADRRVHSEGQSLLPQIEHSSVVNDGLITRSRSADVRAPIPPPKVDLPDMSLLRRVADLPENQRCADCGKGTKSSRWATISLHDQPIVLFLCIRCCGIHRSLGSHISKPRSVDMDRWAPETILLAQMWGNARGNQVWERNRPDDLTLPFREEGMKEYIMTKYVEGRWLSDEDKGLYRVRGM